MNDKENIKTTDQSNGIVKPSAVDYLSGDASFGKKQMSVFLPHELVGGAIPFVAGTEDEAVWNAASQACGTEKVYYTYTVEEGKCWYLACPTDALASNPDSWCPLAAALPGNSEYWDQETVYIYEQEGMASALRWDQDTKRMQVFLGAGRTLLPRIQSMDANFVTINPDIAEMVPWKNRALMSEKLSRAASKTLLLSGVLTVFIILAILFFSYASINLMQRDLKTVQNKTQQASMTLIKDAHAALKSDALNHMVRIQELLDELQQIDGTLVKYEINGNKLQWEALVPKSYQQGSGSIRGKIKQGIEDGDRVRIIGSK